MRHTIERFEVVEWKLNEQIYEYFMAQRRAFLEGRVEHWQENAPRQVQELKVPYVQTVGQIKQVTKKQVNRYAQRLAEDVSYSKDFMKDFIPEETLLFYKISLLSQLREALPQHSINPQTALYVVERENDDVNDDIVGETGNPHMNMYNRNTMERYIRQLNQTDMSFLLVNTRSDKYLYKKRGLALADASITTGQPPQAFVIGARHEYANRTCTLELPLDEYYERTGLPAIFVFDVNDFEHVQDKYHHAKVEHMLWGGEDIFVHKNPSYMRESLEAIVRIVHHQCTQTSRTE